MVPVSALGLAIRGEHPHKKSMQHAIVGKRRYSNRGNYWISFGKAAATRSMAARWTTVRLVPCGGDPATNWPRYRRNVQNFHVNSAGLIHPQTIPLPVTSKCKSMQSRNR